MGDIRQEGVNEHFGSDRLVLPIPVTDPSPIYLESSNRGILLLEQLANGDHNPLEEAEKMLIGNPEETKKFMHIGTTKKFMHIVEFALRNPNGMTEFLLSKIRASLINQGDLFKAAKTEKEKCQLYTDLNRMLETTYQSLNAYAGKEEVRQRDMAATLDALQLLNLGVKISEAGQYDHFHDHMKSVKYRAMFLADLFGIKGLEHLVLQGAARRHDIFKPGVAGYLRSYGRFKHKIQKDIMNRHAELGRNLLDAILPLEIPGRDRILYLVEHHHTPVAELPEDLLLWVLQGADQSDAIVANRKYHGKYDSEQVKAELRKNVEKGLLHPKVMSMLVKYGEFLRPGLVYQSHA